MTLDRTLEIKYIKETQFFIFQFFTNFYRLTLKRKIQNLYTARSIKKDKEDKKKLKRKVNSKEI